jgi:hypothetical protein
MSHRWYLLIVKLKIIVCIDEKLNTEFEWLLKIEKKRKICPNFEINMI